MQELVSKDREPITPFIDRVKQLWEEKEISTVMVMGGSGDYFDVADNVICMDEFKPVLKTEEAKKIAAKYKSERMPEAGGIFGEIRHRLPVSSGLDSSKGKKAVKIEIFGRRSILFGKNEIDMTCIEQIVHQSQLRSIGYAMEFAKKFMTDKQSLEEVIKHTLGEISAKGLDVLAPHLSGEFAMFRALELAAAFNRLRTFRVNQIK